MQSTMISATSLASVDVFLPPKLDFVEQIAFKAAGNIFYNVLRPVLTGREVDALAFINSKLPLESADLVKKGSVEEGEAEEVDGDEIEDEDDVDDIIDAYLDSFSSEQDFEQLKPSALAPTPIQWFGNSTVSPATPVNNRITITAPALHWIGNSTITPATPIKKAPIPRLWSATTATPPRRTRRNKENIKPSTVCDDTKDVKRARRVTPPSLLEMMLNNSLVQ